MSESSLPPSPPTQSSNGLLIGGALAALLVVGGGVFFALRGGDAPEPAQPATAAPVVSSTPVRSPAPPPPPPPPPPAEEEVSPASTATASSASTKTAAGPGAAGTATENKGPAGCSGGCTGSADATLRDALRLRGASAKGCYNKALRSNATLRGKMTVAVRVNPSGSACSASAASDTLGDPSVTSCILQKFRSGSYPKPKGGCVDVQVPLNFVPGAE